MGEGPGEATGRFELTSVGTPGFPLWTLPCVPGLPWNSAEVVLVGGSGSEGGGRQATF